MGDDACHPSAQTCHWPGLSDDHVRRQLCPEAAACASCSDCHCRTACRKGKCLWLQHRHCLAQLDQHTVWTDSIVGEVTLHDRHRLPKHALICQVNGNRLPIVTRRKWCQALNSDLDCNMPHGIWYACCQNGSHMYLTLNKLCVS